MVQSENDEGRIRKGYKGKAKTKATMAMVASHLPPVAISTEARANTHADWA